jgi:hypothetical protein
MAADAPKETAGNAGRGQPLPGAIRTKVRRLPALQAWGALPAVADTETKR